MKTVKFIWLRLFKIELTIIQHMVILFRRVAENIYGRENRRRVTVKQKTNSLYMRRLIRLKCSCNKMWEEKMAFKVGRHKPFAFISLAHSLFKFWFMCEKIKMCQWFITEVGPLYEWWNIRLIPTSGNPTEPPFNHFWMSEILGPRAWWYLFYISFVPKVWEAFMKIWGGISESWPFHPSFLCGTLKTFFQQIW